MLTSYSPYTVQLPLLLFSPNAKRSCRNSSSLPFFLQRLQRPMLRTQGPRTNRLSSMLPMTPPHQQPQHLSHLPLVHPSPPPRGRGGSSSLIASQNLTRSLRAPRTKPTRGGHSSRVYGSVAHGGAGGVRVLIGGARVLRLPPPPPRRPPPGRRFRLGPVLPLRRLQEPPGAQPRGFRPG